MAVFNLFLSTLLLPVVAVVLLWRKPRRPLAAWLATFLMASGVVGFSLLVAPWGWFGFPVRIVLALAFVTSMVMSLRRPIPSEPVEESAVRLMVKVAIGFFFGGVAVGVLRAHETPPNVIDLAFPLKNGTYLVAHGGSTPAANIHFADARQRYAVDLVKLNGAGFRARGIYPRDPNAYAIFGEAVFSPCQGRVRTAIDWFADGVPDPKNPLGNHVVVQCGDVLVTLAQLQRGSISARPGSAIAREAIIARAGHSGLSAEPHLHIHAVRNGTSVAMTFEGRWLVRNGIVRR